MSPRQILSHFWGYDRFRPLQEEIVQSVLDGQDTLVLLPTGGGKSVCFQVPALAMPGVCIVVTPLIALMKDQVGQLAKRGIPAVAIYSGMHHREIDIALDNCIYGNTKFLYLSPERLKTEIVIERVKQMQVCLLAIDEAHCISAWGYDFRPAYLEISDFRQYTPDAPVVALTASATPDVQRDIVEKLVMRGLPVAGQSVSGPAIFRQTFARPNLSYSAIREENKLPRLLTILDRVPGTAIVYVRSRRQTQQVAAWLGAQGVTADFYHAGLTTAERSAKQDAWLTNQTRVMVSTNAFGMGIDKPDVRTVVHLDLPDSLEAYYQEAGRAGRDGQKAYAVLLWHPADPGTMAERVAQQFQPAEMLRRVYQAMANANAVPMGAGELVSYDFDLNHLIGTYNLPATETHYAIKQLELEGLIELSDSYYRPSKLTFRVDHRHLYEFQVLNVRFDPFIKTLLRIYGGDLFTDFQVISEAVIASAFMISQNEVVNMLTQLHQREIVIYEQQKDKPQLTYLTPRYDSAMLPIDHARLADRRERAMRRANASVRYTENTSQCRTRLLQAYFGEQPGDACGICDTCLRLKREAAAPASAPETVREAIRDYVAQTEQTGVAPRQLANYFDQTTSTEALAGAVRQMLAEDEISYNPAGNLVLNRPAE
jgi:ATP-dependent DNA helicase RecQ